MGKLMTRDVAFSSIQLVSNIFIKTNQYEKSKQLAIDLTCKEPLNPICWHALAISCRNVEDFDFCFICLRSLEFNIKMFGDKPRYKESAKYLDELMEYAQKEMVVVHSLISIKELAHCAMKE